MSSWTSLSTYSHKRLSPGTLKTRTNRGSATALIDLSRVFNRCRSAARAHLPRRARMWEAGGILEMQVNRGRAGGGGAGSREQIPEWREFGQICVPRARLNRHPCWLWYLLIPGFYVTGSVKEGDFLKSPNSLCSIYARAPRRWARLRSQ